MSQPKAKPQRKSDPFLATPPGTRASSAWLTKVQEKAAITAERAAKPSAWRNAALPFSPTLSLEQNAACAKSADAYSFSVDNNRLYAWECLLQWHGEAAFASFDNRLDSKDVAKLVTSFHSDAAQDVLFQHLQHPHVRELIAERAKLWPYDTLRRLLALDPRKDDPAADLLLRLLQDHPHWLPALRAFWDTRPHEADTAPHRKTLERLLSASAERVSDATLEDLPPLLKSPPWAKGTPSVQVPVLALTPLADPPVLHWDDYPRPADLGPPPLRTNHYGDQTKQPFISSVEYILRSKLRRFSYNDKGLPVPVLQPSQRERFEEQLQSWGLAEMALYCMGVPLGRIGTLMETQQARAGDLPTEVESPGERLELLAYLDDRLALSLLPLLEPSVWLAVSRVVSVPNRDFVRLLKRFNGLHLPWLLAHHNPNVRSYWHDLLNVIESDELAAWISREGFKTRYTRPFALGWLLRYPACAARALIPLALGADEAEQAHARYHLQRLVQHGHLATLEQQAQRYGEETAQAFRQWLEIAPERLLPAKLPTLPKWLVFGKLPQLVLRSSGRAVPLDKIPDVLMPMALSKAGMAYAGMAQLQAAITPESLSSFMLALFDQWEDNDCPAKDRWIFELQGLMGNDATARHLVPRIRQWRQTLARQRAYEGLTMLVQIGTDSALLLLHSFTQQKRFSDLAQRATEAMAQVAEQRNLTLDELADRTVPTLGLNESGERTLDFGPRQFTLRLDAQFAPCVTDATGKRLKDLPKPGALDTEALAKAAAADYKEFKQQLKTVARTQVARLEAAMCERRRWTGADFMSFFARHPLMRHFSQRLLWGVFDATGQWQQGFRVAEDGSLSDMDDATFCLPQEALVPDPEEPDPTAAPAPHLHVGLAHPLDVPEDQRKAWEQVFFDYELLPPFEQLARATYSLTPQEAAAGDLPQYAHRRVGTGSLLGLENRGWKRHAGDGGMIDQFQKKLPDGLNATLAVEDGWFIAGAPPSDQSHTVTSVSISRSDSRDAVASADKPQWSALHPVTLSELLRDIEKMVWHTQ